MVVVGNCSLNPAPKDDDDRPSPVPRVDGTPSAVPIPKDDETLGAISIPKGDEILSSAAEDDVVKVEDTGIEKFSVGCITRELLVLAVDIAFGRAKLNIREVLPVALPTSEGIIGTVKLLLLTVEDASAGLLVGLLNVGAGNTIEGC